MNLVLTLVATCALFAASCSSDDGGENSSNAASTGSTATSSSDTPAADDTTSDSTTSDEDVSEEVAADTDSSDDDAAVDEATTTTTAVGSETGTELPASLSSDWLSSYERVDDDFGTMVTVTVADGSRTIESNALPDHDTGEFPNAGNPNTIEAQSLSWTYAESGVNTGTATAVRTTGVAINGVKFEPGTGESVSCESGESYRIEAIQELYDLGLDFNNAHVQPGGEYH